MDRNWDSMTIAEETQMDLCNTSKRRLDVAETVLELWKWVQKKVEREKMRKVMT